MNTHLFYDVVADDSMLRWDGVKDNPPRVYVTNKQTQHTIELPVAEIAAHDQYQLVNVLHETRSLAVLTRVARIVGYFSLTKNWNRSKLAELRDRHKGDYSVVQDTIQQPVRTENKVAS